MRAPQTSRRRLCSFFGRRTDRRTRRSRNCGPVPSPAGPARVETDLATLLSRPLEALHQEMHLRPTSVFPHLASHKVHACAKAVLAVDQGLCNLAILADPRPPAASPCRRLRLAFSPRLPHRAQAPANAALPPQHCIMRHDRSHKMSCAKTPALGADVAPTPPGKQDDAPTMFGHVAAGNIPPGLMLSFLGTPGGGGGATRHKNPRDGRGNNGRSNRILLTLAGGSPQLG